MAYGQPYNQQAFTGVQVGGTGATTARSTFSTAAFRGMGTTSRLWGPDRASG